MNEYQYPKAVMMASESFPWYSAGIVFLGIGKSPFAKSTIAMFLSLSAHT